MRRRDIPQVLMASAAGATLPSTLAAEPADLQEALRAHGAVRIPVGTHTVTGKLQTLVQNNITGDSRHDSILQPTSFSDYVLEVGDGRRTPNAGRIERLRLYGAPGNLGCLHMNSLSHMWHLDDLLFSGGPCPALVVDNCWDSNYTNIDILGHVTPGNDPACTSAVIFRSGTANIYCRGLRIEGARSGGIYVDAGPNYVTGGKIDDGFGGPQTAAAITVASTGSLMLEDFYLGGMLGQFHLDVAGTLRLGRVTLDGGSDKPAAILDRRAWTHINPATAAGVSPPQYGPFIPGLDLGEAQFHRAHPSVNTVTGAAVFSQIHPVRQVKRLTIESGRTARDGARVVATSLRPTHVDTHKNAFLVNNATGARRKILESATDGTLVLLGGEPVPTGADWSIEFCASHATPVRHQSVWLDSGQALFAVVARSLSITGQVAYVTDPADASYGATKFRLSGDSPVAGRDLRGLFLVDERTGTAYYIEYGADDGSYIAVLYDRRAQLQPTSTYSVVAGYVEHTTPNFARSVVSGGNVVPDITGAGEFEISVTRAAALAIENPVLATTPVAGERITFTLINATSGRLAEVTWGNGYKLAEWVNPAPGTSRSIEFRFNGRNWVEIARTPGDVPN